MCPYQQIEGRKPVSTSYSIDEKINKQFQRVCGKHKMSANLELEKLMESYIEQARKK